MAKERTIIAHFPSSTKAEAARQSLSEVDLPDVHIRRNSRFGVTQNTSMNGNAETLTGLTLFSANVHNDGLTASSRVLMGADPSVSGSSIGGDGLAGGHAFTVVAYVPEDRVTEAVNILKQHDGEV